MPRGKVRKTKEKFIEDAKNKHGDKYSYEEVNYQTSHVKVKLICPNHGEFFVTPGNHLNGSGCNACGIEATKTRLEDFIEKSKDVHGDKYDYSKVEYIRAQSKVVVGCPFHGDFMISPNSHYKGSGCRLCSALASAKKRASTIEHFIEKALLRHGNKYDYSITEYIKLNDKLEIICPKHGLFTQRAADHLAGNGCQLCASERDGYSYLERCVDPSFAMRQGRLYLVKITKNDYSFGKVGVSVAFKGRLSGYRSEGLFVEEIYSYPMKAIDSCYLEISVLDFIEKNKYKFTPNFTFSGMTECFDLKYLENIVDHVEDYIIENNSKVG